MSANSAGDNQDCFTQHYEELHELSQPLGIAWLTAGFHPFATREDIDWVPKGRYRVMRNYLPTRGGRALDMMTRTCTVQANFDYASERECGERLRLAMAVGPIVTAMFANSPYREGRHEGPVSLRTQTWTDVDPDRCGILPFVFDREFRYTHYVEWALDVPMFFVNRGGVYHPHHVPFRQFLRDGFVDPQGKKHHAVWPDWVLHLSTVFPEVRLKPYIEVRTADAVSSRFVCALPALWKGLLYDPQAGAEGWALVRDMDLDERVALWNRAWSAGLHDDFIHHVAQRLIELSRQGLDRLDVRDSKGRTEARFLDPLQTLVATRNSPGAEVLATLGETPGRDAEARRSLVRAFHFAGAGNPSD